MNNMPKGMDAFTIQLIHPFFVIQRNVLHGESEKKRKKIASITKVVISKISRRKLSTVRFSGSHAWHDRLASFYWYGEGDAVVIQNTRRIEIYTNLIDFIFGTWSK